MPARHPLIKAKVFTPGSAKGFKIGDRRVGLFNVNGTLYAIDDICPHAGAPLSGGPFIGKVASCPWHGAEYDVTTGKVLSPPACRDVQTFPVFINGDMIEVEI
jgi:3-phenylpropionate/trans-cinnamate dioxygenase ferredoxin component